MRRKKYNEYGVKLDRNGYAPTIIPHMALCCNCCGMYRETVRHEIFFGDGRRDISKALGLWINVCPDCHEEIHHGKNAASLQAHYHTLGQQVAMAYYHWTVTDFRRRFYKNYLDIQEEA